MTELTKEQKKKVRSAIADYEYKIMDKIAHLTKDNFDTMTYGESKDLRYEIFDIIEGDKSVS